MSRRTSWALQCLWIHGQCVYNRFKGTTFKGRCSRPAKSASGLCKQHQKIMSAPEPLNAEKEVQLTQNAREDRK